MRAITRAKKTERVCLPRRLVPRRPISYVGKMYARIYEDNIARFQVGDEITFESNDRRKHHLVILGIRPGGFVDTVIHDGRSYHLITTLEDLARLRVIRVERFGLENVAMYRQMFKLDEILEVAA